MAIPRGSKPNVNGKKVYSQTANAIRKRQKLGLGEFAGTNAAAVEGSPPPISVEAPPEPAAAPGGFSTEPIGVTTTATIVAPMEPEPAEEETVYFCDNCKHRPITPADSQCPTCEETLNWSGLS